MFKLKGITVGGTAVGLSVGGGAWVGWAGVPQAERKKSIRIPGTKIFQDMSLSLYDYRRKKHIKFCHSEMNCVQTT
jgi:hypothetical protein